MMGSAVEGALFVIAVVSIIIGFLAEVIKWFLMLSIKIRFKERKILDSLFKKRKFFFEKLLFVSFFNDDSLRRRILWVNVFIVLVNICYGVLFYCLIWIFLLSWSS